MLHRRTHLPSLRLLRPVFVVELALSGDGLRKVGALAEVLAVEVEDVDCGFDARGNSEVLREGDL
jgi:hypothetical protein